MIQTRITYKKIPFKIPIEFGMPLKKRVTHYLQKT